MQSKGAITLLAVLIALACLYQLSFTGVSAIQQNKAEKFAEAAVEAEQQKASFAEVSDLDKAYYLDSIRKERNRYYIDSVSAEKVYLGYTYKEVQEKEINLGLDLKGGMNVMLEVQLSDLVRALSNYNTSPEFEQAIALAKERERASGGNVDFITLFHEAWDEVAPNQRLSQIFGTIDLRDRINAQSTNDQVIAVLREQAESAVANSFNVLRNRIDRFGVTSPNIQRLGTSSRILVELPGVKEPERVRKLLQGTASLEFWTTYENPEVFRYLQEVNSIIKDMESMDETPAAVKPEAVQASSAETGSASDDLVAELTRQEDSISADELNYARNNPFFYALNPSMYNGQLMPGPVIGIAHYRDTAKINNWLKLPQVKAALPADLVPMWTVKPSAEYPGGNYYQLIAIKVNTRDGKAPLDGGVVSDARVSYNNMGGQPEVDMAMNAEGAQTWARLTADNIGKSIAIVLDGMVYSFPRVNTEITGGRSVISGSFTIEEATDLANVLNSGKLPAPATIVQEQVVGPSLGSASIQAGMISFAIAFLLVLLYMIVFYKGAGLAADAALLCNVLFLFGALASFGAVLTLPGIAGLVLTLGMAVDANVIIYERVKEELRAGKALRLAISDGYKHAYSAIIDGNLTTIMTGLVLFFFGSGPVQGFATTLVIGLITSMLTSIFISRLIFEARLSKGKNISFYTKFSKNFLQNTHIDFVKIRKYAYILSTVLILVCVGSIVFKGFTYGVDFTGGRTYVVRFDQDVAAEEIRAAVLEEFGEGVEVKQFGGASQMKITTTYMIEDQSTETDAVVDHMLYEALKEYFVNPITYDQFISTLENPNGIIQSDKVGPTIANDMKRDSLIAVAIALFAIFAYIAIRFKGWTWGLGGVVSTAHDAIVTVGFFSLFTGVLPFTLDVDQTFIAAVLTIIGYSINDSVIIFDRIREYRKLYPKRELYQNINDAINSTLARTVNTSGTTFIVMLAIAIFGGEVIRGFAVALLVGIFVGTYSSVFVGTPIMYDLSLRKARKEAKKLQAAGK
ncbi:MAG TPA: protein translocase subunit SecDF [Candidatus Coprenecus stercoravium]|uniref:Multifunctional fusion protein n=1 Tax=Candidatus Coprenecus stercoravium TaxID=2840735 RepID=A0A9D2GR94_9BACT|nr:protein translocase subunit SecDF [Candidatus Coprenecus stercoravium]